MKKLDKFILKAFLGPFVAILLVVIFVLMMQFLWVYIDELVGKGLSPGVIVEFMFWGGCTVLPLALPLATLLSSMMTMGQFGENNELMAMKASGISIMRIMAPIIATSFAISVGTFFTVNNLVPHAYNEIYTLRDDIGRTKEEIKIPAGTFYDGIDGYILRANENDDKSGMMYGVMVYDHTSNKGNTAISLADSAKVRLSKEKDYLIFTMFSGINYQENNVKHYRDTTLELSKIAFDRQELVISLKNYAFEKSEGNRFGSQINAMRLSQLVHEQDSLQHIADSTKSEHISRFQNSGGLVKDDQLDTSVFRRISRVFPEKNAGKVWKNLDEKKNAYEKAMKHADQMASELTGFSRESYEYTFYLRRANLAILKKFATALACFILFFIGAPLGALIRKGGLGATAIIAVLFFVLYWVVDITGTKLAKDGAVTASTGAFISAYVLAPIGVFLSWKAIKDTSVFNSDNISALWRKLKRKVINMFKKTRIVYMGTPDFAVEPLDNLIRHGYEIAAVVTVPDKPSGRGLQVNESAVKKYAVSKGLPVLQPVKLKDLDFLKQLSDLKADLFVVVAFRMLPEEVWSMPRLGTFNLHAALLPQYRGAAPINWAVINGEAMTGVTTFMIDENIDTGGIIFREEHRIGPEDTAGDVHDALMELGSELVLRTVEAIEDKAMEVRVQRSFIQGDEVLKPAPKITRETCRIDWDQDSKHIYNLIRGLSPYPGAFTTLVKEGSEDDAGQQLKIYFGRQTDGCGRTPGTIISDGKTFLRIACGDGKAIDVTDLQLMGKRRMDIEDFLRGFREPENWKAV